MLVNSDNKRIAKNTVMLYIRMLLSIMVSLYTSRVVLQVLGVDDYGIYNVVGGIVAMFGFLNASMSGATSRFLTFEMGRGDFARLRDTFNSALIVHLGIALVILVVAETVGLWFVNNKLVIPEERIFAAHVVYQLSIVSMMVGVTQVPYNASIIAHEKMDVYAYVELLNVFLKLGIVYLLLIGHFDKLILYASLVLAVTVIVAITYRFYCVQKFEECRFRRVWHPNLLKPMLSFFGWDLFGNLSTLMRTHGVGILLNMFFGTILNAANGIACMVQGVIMAFASNVLVAFRPQIVKNYASGDYDKMVGLLHRASSFTTILLLLFTVPLLAEAEFVLTVWLGNWPAYTASLLRCVLLFNLFANLSSVVISAIHATGNIKRPSLINGTLYMSVIPVSYLAYSLGMPPQTAFVYNVLAVFCGMLSNIWTLHLYVRKFSIRGYFCLLLKCLIVTIVAYVATISIQSLMLEGWVRLLYSISVSTVVIASLSFWIVLSMQEREWVISKVRIML